ncbi:MAG: hypothetical protein ACI4J0_04995 [Huintestinicola sp.]|uniref:hypothetical protein n=1 Tax=Huintestinicola sp. TaxID=2981661 RepID=UPI003F05BE73
MEEILMVRGDTLKLCIESIMTSDGGEYTLSDTDRIFMELRKEDDPERAVISRTISAADRSEAGLPIVIYPSETENIPFGNYVFDIRLVMDGDNIFTIIPATRLKVIGNITAIPKG